MISDEDLESRGRAASEIEIALNLLQESADPQLITKATGLSLDYLKGLVLDFVLNAGHHIPTKGNMTDFGRLVEKGYRESLPMGVTFMAIVERWAAQKNLEGSGEANAEGNARGKEKGKNDIALSLLLEGSDPQFVAKVTGLPLDDVKRLQEDAE